MPNHHRNAKITGPSRRSYEPVLKYYDKMSDTAVLKVEGESFDAFDLPRRAVRVGERVYAIGNPRGLEQSISERIVSGLRREDDGTSWIQHSAPISPGSSGGALISSRGELLGINAWSLRESQGLNFAVPTATLADAYLAARAGQGPLRFPGLPPVSGGPSPPMSPKEVSPPAPPPSPRSQPVLGSGQEDPLLRKAADAVLQFAEALPKYVCNEVVSRYVSTTNPPTWQALDMVSAQVAYRNGRENYRVTLNGKSTSRPPELTGAWSTGEYATLLIDLFSPTSKAEFHFRRDGRASGTYSKIYDFRVRCENSRWDLRFGSQHYTPAFEGSTWIDPKTGHVMRIEIEARGVPANFSSDHVQSATDYQYVRLGGGTRVAATSSRHVSNLPTRDKQLRQKRD